MAVQDHQVSITPYLCIFIRPLYTGNDQAGLGVQWALHWSYRPPKSNTAVRGPFPPCANKGHARDLPLFARLASGGYSPLARKRMFLHAHRDDTRRPVVLWVIYFMEGVIYSTEGRRWPLVLRCGRLQGPFLRRFVVNRKSTFFDGQNPHAIV